MGWGCGAELRLIWQNMIHFLSGLPRSGSTLLAAILNQHPQIKVSATSPLIDVMGAIAMTWEQNPSVKASADQDEVFALLKTVMDAHYAKEQKPIILDKSRGWPDPKIIETMTKVIGAKPKIVATVRNIPDCAASFVRVAKPDNVKDFVRTSQLIGHLKQSYVTLQAGYSAHPECFLFVDYDDLLRQPEIELQRVCAFLNADAFDFDYSNIDGSVVAERDEEAWGIKDLHDVKAKLGRQHSDKSQDVLGSLYAGFLQPQFWDLTAEPRPKAAIDLQLEANIRGDFAKGREIANMLEAVSPDDDRAAFNRGWHLIHEGQLIEGTKLLDRGRAENVFGNTPPTGAPLWDGKQQGTVLLNLEGGLGDQIHGVRFARNIAARGNKVVVAGSQQLIPMFIERAGIHAACTHVAAAEVYHDFWVPSMSAVVPLGMEWKDVRGNAYIRRSSRQKTDRMRIGMRWQGNPRFEEEQHRLFDANLMFDNVYSGGVDFVSLQRDEGAEKRPDWVEGVPLDNWKQTAAVISNLDLVITSCTSVAHLAGAMGVPTWVIVPIMPYYLWALPGDKTPWYSSVRLFRQTKFGDWHDVFERIGAQLRKPKYDLRAS